MNARDLQEPVRDYIHRETQGFCQPLLQRTFVVIDGLDEIGVTRANNLLTQVQAYADANPKLTAVVTSRLCLLFIHPRAPNLINLRSASTMPA